MGRIGVPYEAVAIVADEILADGATPLRRPFARVSATLDPTVRLARTWKVGEPLAPRRGSHQPKPLCRLQSCSSARGRRAHRGRDQRNQDSAAVALAVETSARSQAEGEIDRIGGELETATARITELEDLVAEDRGRIAQLQDFTPCLRRAFLKPRWRSRMPISALPSPLPSWKQPKPVRSLRRRVRRRFGATCVPPAPSNSSGFARATRLASAHKPVERENKRSI